MNAGQGLVDRLGGRLAGLRGRITPNAEMEKIKARGINVYVPTDEEKAQWIAAGDEFLKSETVNKMVPAETIQKAKAAQE